MSVKTWKEKFYPVSADQLVYDAAGDEAMLKAALRKWVGLRLENLREHNLWQYGTAIWEDVNPAEFRVDSRSCALCQVHKGCEGCPLLREIVDPFEDNGGGVASCDGSDDDDINPYASFIHDGDPEPMIELITEALVKTVRERLKCTS